MRKILFASVAVGAISFSGAALALTSFPGVNLNPLGPEFLITFGPGGAISTTLNPVYAIDPGPYDGVEDTYFGVINNSGSPISSFALSSPLDIGGFDGDGIGVYAGVGTNAQDTSFGKYGGPNAFFTNNLGTSLTVNFVIPIPSGGTNNLDIFSLEEQVSLNNIVVGVPEPSTWAMMLLGFAGLGFAALRRNKKTGSAFAAA